MPYIIGSQKNIGIAKEATRGTAESTVDFWIPKAELSIEDTVDLAVDESTVGVIEDAIDRQVIAKAAEGDVSGSIHTDFMGLLLLNALGSVSTTADSPEAGVHTHDFSVSQSVSHPSLTLFYADGEQDYKHALGMLSSIEFTFPLDGYATFSAAFRSKAGATASLTPSYAANDRIAFLPQHITFKTATNKAGLDAASAINIKNFSFTIEKNVEDDRALGSLDQVDINNKQMSVEGTIEITFDGTTAQAFKTDMLAGTNKAMRISAVNSDVTIGSSSNPTMVFDFNKVSFGEFSRSGANGDIVTASIPFKALYSKTDGEMITAQVINDTASY